MSQWFRVLMLLLAEFVGIASAANHDWVFTALASVMVLFWVWRIADEARMGSSL